MAFWSSSEIGYLEQHAGEGAQAVADALGRSISSVTHQAHKWGISLRVRHVCPKCGHATRSPLSPKTGWCVACNLEMHRDRAIEHDAAIRREVEAEERRIRSLERDRQRLYSSTCRQKKKLQNLRDLGKSEENSR